MIARGCVKNGVVVLDNDAGLPDGAKVIVWPEGCVPEAISQGFQKNDENSAVQRRRLIEAIERIAALPLEGSTDPFSGADHDKVLYGKP